MRVYFSVSAINMLCFFGFPRPLSAGQARSEFGGAARHSLSFWSRSTAKPRFVMAHSGPE